MAHSRGRDLTVASEHDAQLSARAQVRFAKTPVFKRSDIPRGRSAHIGGGVFLRRCRECNDFVLTFGHPYCSPIEDHESAKHGIMYGGILS